MTKAPLKHPTTGLTENNGNFVLDIPYLLDTDSLSELLRIKPGTDSSEAFKNLVNQAQEVGRPKVLYKVAFIEKRDEDDVTIDEVTFRSRALRKNLDSIERVFPYIATCGTEVDDIWIEPSDLIKKYWLSVIKQDLLRTSVEYLWELIEKRYRISSLSAMNPGSGEASVWPIEQQQELFSIFGDVEEQVGVKLTPSYLMLPDISVSGILFPTEKSYVNCQLCERENCPSRSAPFDRQLWESVYQE